MRTNRNKTSASAGTRTKRKVSSRDLEWKLIEPKVHHAAEVGLLLAEGRRAKSETQGQKNDLIEPTFSISQVIDDAEKYLERVPICQEGDGLIEQGYPESQVAFLRGAREFLERLLCFKCPWPIETLFAPPEAGSKAPKKANVHELIKALRRRREKNEATGEHQDVHLSIEIEELLIEYRNKRCIPQVKATRAAFEKGERTRDLIDEEYRSLEAEGVPRRKFASLTAKNLLKKHGVKLTATHVRRTAKPN